jgi:cyclic beta-1,2-glucan synthetase
VWSGNSRENRITPWSNDPVLDPASDALYLRDEAAGEFWSLFPRPCPAPAQYLVRHGFGASRFTHSHSGLEIEVTVAVPSDLPVRITRISLTNTGSESREISLFCYQQLVMGLLAWRGGRHVRTQAAADEEIVFARNVLAGVFGETTAFASVSGVEGHAWHAGASRSDFIGPAGDLSCPQALSSLRKLSWGEASAGDACFAQQCCMTLVAGETAVISFLLGAAESQERATAIVRQLRRPGAVEDVIRETERRWSEMLGRLQIRTPAPEIDLMVNGWASYQNLSSRFWARTAFYQSSGACGFRDQLQDAGALCWLRPDITRSQILLHAAQQFSEGDVLHWWHPPPFYFGLRSRCSDDLNWLPLVVSDYVRMSGDAAVLDEQIPFLHGRLLRAGEEDAGMTPNVSGECGSVHEHCCRALDRSLRVGDHGLPLMGAGDWNDGMNRVGIEGRGESVWMGFFLCRILDRFIPLCAGRGDSVRAGRYASHLASLRAALNDAGWDGEWYRRAFFDNGSVLGTAAGAECRIDALAQAWAVLSGVAPPERAASAMAAVEWHLVSGERKIIRLLAPPFVEMADDPGYIKGYQAGVRENGGQYTHAACWVAQATAELGMNERAAELLRMLSPVTHGGDAESMARFQLEPYVIPADICGHGPATGRGGWNWYTGSAGWFFRVAVESILGITLHEGRVLRVKPCIPASWREFHFHYQFPGTAAVCALTVSHNGGGSRVAGAELDGRPAPVEDGVAVLAVPQDGKSHRATVRLE